MGIFAGHKINIVWYMTYLLARQGLVAASIFRVEELVKHRENCSYVG
jgi:hypothetical protein